MRWAGKLESVVMKRRAKRRGGRVMSELKKHGKAVRVIEVGSARLSLRLKSIDITTNRVKNKSSSNASSLFCSSNINNKQKRRHRMPIPISITSNTQFLD